MTTKKLSEIGREMCLEEYANTYSREEHLLVMTLEERRELLLAAFIAGSQSGNNVMPGLRGYIPEDFNEFLDSEGL